MDNQSRKWSRIDYVGQNGNTGEHYMEQMELFTYCPVPCETTDCEKHSSKAPSNQAAYWMIDKPKDCEKYVPCID